MEIIDRRIKMCLNPECENAKKHVKFRPQDKTCPKCGDRLSFVCAKCYIPIEDEGKEHRFCYRHEAEIDDKKEKLKQNIKNGSKAVGGTLIAAVVLVPKVIENAPKAMKVAADIAKDMKDIL